MGYIADMVEARTTSPFLGRYEGERLWRRVFGDQRPERQAKEPTEDDREPKRRPLSIAGSDTAFKRLLQAMRSLAPGGWSDDRWEQSRHLVGIAYVAIHRLSEQMSQSEFQVFRKDRKHPDGKRPVMEGEPEYALVKLLERPNHEDSFGDLMYNVNCQMYLTGMSLLWMVPNRLKQPMELYPIPTATAIPQPAINPQYPNGYWRIQPIYPYGPFSSHPTPMSAVGAAIPSEWMLRIKFPHPFLRYEGYAPLTALRLHLDEIEMMDRSRHYTMRRSISPSAVLNFDEIEGMQPLPEEEIERIRAEFEGAQQGPENHGQLYVAAPGSKLEPWGAKPVDMEYQQGWDQLVSFVLGGFGITKPAAGMVEDSSYSTLFATLKQLHLLTLGPNCSRIGAKLTRQLAPFFGDDLIIEVRCPRIDDHELKQSKLQMLMQAKAITKNEFRQELDMPLTQEDWGKEMAGAEAQQQQQPGMPGAGGAPGGGEGGAGGGLAALLGGAGGAPGGGEETPEEAKPEPEEVTKTRPDTGTLGEGALGPRKSLGVNRVNGLRHRYTSNGHARVNGKAR